MTARRKKRRAKRAKRPNTRDRQRALNARAMPDVQRLVKRYGRLAVGNCLAKIKARDKQAQKLAALRRDVAAMERALR
jgi:hypothetical protein